ncbi:MAG: YbaB/EbfC family nucleoid-associated protein [Pseudomonadota bacterium]
MDMMKMMKQAQQMQQKISDMKASMADERIDGSAAGGGVKVTLSGTGEAVAVHIDPELLSEQTVLQDLLIAAFNDAQRRMREHEKKRTTEMMGELGLPAGIKLPGF